MIYQIMNPTKGEINSDKRKCVSENESIVCFVSLNSILFISNIDNIIQDEPIE